MNNYKKDYSNIRRMNVSNLYHSDIPIKMAITHTIIYGPSGYCLFSEIIRRIFNYQDRMYGMVINFREHATTFQIFLSYIFIFGFIVLIFTSFLLAYHDFILYPDVGRARLNENY